jgi:hypothetical protein
MYYTRISMNSARPVEPQETVGEGILNISIRTILATFPPRGQRLTTPTENRSPVFGEISPLEGSVDLRDVIGWTGEEKGSENEVKTAVLSVHRTLAAAVARPRAEC